MATVRNRGNETVDAMLHRFKRKVNDDGILADIKKHEYYIGPSEKRRIKRKEAQAKARKLARKQKRFYTGGMNESI